MDEQIERIREQIKEKVIKKSLKLEQKTFGIITLPPFLKKYFRPFGCGGKVCALGAVLLGEEYRSDNCLEDAITLLGISWGDGYNIISGFDSYPNIQHNHGTGFFQLGWELAKWAHEEKRLKVKKQ